MDDSAVARISIRGGGHFWGSASWGVRGRRIFKKFLRKLLKMHYFSIFFKKFSKPCVNFSHVWTKNTWLGNFEKIVKIFDENSMENLNFFTIFGNFVT